MIQAKIEAVEAEVIAVLCTITRNYLRPSIYPRAPLTICNHSRLGTSTANPNAFPLFLKLDLAKLASLVKLSRAAVGASVLDSGAQLAGAGAGSRAVGRLPAKRSQHRQQQLGC